MTIIAIAALGLFFRFLEAGPVPSQATDRPCVSFMLPVPATAQHAEYNTIRVDNNIDATEFAVQADTWSFNDSSRIVRNISISDTFNLSVQLCIPSNGTKKDHLFIATHGGLFDKRYWDPAIDPSQYSFVDAALAAGYSILTYDRLGNGLSDKPDAYTVVQAPIQLEILRGITQMARNGDVFKYISSTKDVTPPANAPSHVTFKKIIHVGHSFGSVLTTAFLATYGNLSDAAVITGYIINEHVAELRKTAFAFEYAAQSDPRLFSDRPSGYMTHGSKGGLQNIFFSTRGNAATGTGGFEPEVMNYAYSIRQTITTSELMVPRINVGRAEDFAGPVQFVLAEWDFGTCRGDCRLGIDPATVKETLYPKATDIDISLQEGFGHALTMHRGADLGYKATLEWLKGNGL